MDKSNRIKGPRSPVTFIDNTDKKSKQKGTFGSREVKPVATNITDRGDLSTRLDDLENENIDVKVNKDKDTTSVQSTDILKPVSVSKEKFLNLNGKITGRGVIYSSLFMFFKKLLNLFGITSFKGCDDRYWCKHLSFAVMPCN